MNKIEFKRLIKTLVKEEMTKKKKMMEYENPSFSDTRGNKDLPSGYPEFVESYIPEDGATKEEKSFYQKLLKAIDEVAKFFGKSKKEVTEKEAKQLVNKDIKK
jgi:cytochrome oxidase Cu insertion factor (SCO1/SenC/PrrC family)